LAEHIHVGCQERKQSTPADPAECLERAFDRDLPGVSLQLGFKCVWPERPTPRLAQPTLEGGRTQNLVDNNHTRAQYGSNPQYPDNDLRARLGIGTETRSQQERLRDQAYARQLPEHTLRSPSTLLNHQEVISRGQLR